MGVVWFQKRPDYILDGNQAFLIRPIHYSSINIFYSLELLKGFTLTAPIQFWQQASNKPMRSFELIL